MDIDAFLQQHRLPASYRTIAQKWFIPIGDEIIKHQNSAKGPFYVGINGCQGSGKSTLGAFLHTYLGDTYQRNVVSLSLDDFYLPQSERNALAVKVHPLLATRGVPGTHDVALMAATFKRLAEYGTVSIPRFNKATDNPFPVIDWPVVNSPLDIVIMEGWCWGVPHQSDAQLAAPTNELERQEDPLGIWRRYVNKQISAAYEPIYQSMDFWIMLQAPGFEAVLDWRIEQEHRLAASNPKDSSGLMNDAQISRFIQYFQRLTEHGLQELPKYCHHVLKLDSKRNIVEHSKPLEFT